MSDNKNEEESEGMKQVQLAFHKNIISRINAMENHYIKNIAPLINQTEDEITKELGELREESIQKFKDYKGIKDS